MLLDYAKKLNKNKLPSKIIPDWSTGIPFWENTKDYFRRGTFDMFDLIAIASGTAIAYFVSLTIINHK